jgi:hypothetical protein
MTDAGNAPSWLFSFVDLAFLMLIAMTQLASDETGPDLADIIVPKIEANATESRPVAAQETWQLRIHPPSEAAASFELIRSGDPMPGERVRILALETALDGLKAGGGGRPLLAPHEDSRSQDLLDAVAALEARWPGRRRASVLPRLAAAR